MSQDIALNPRSFAKLLLRHKKKIIFWPLASVALGAAVILFCPRLYQSEAKLFLRVGRETVGLDPTATTGQTISMSPLDRKDEIKSAVDVLRSRGVAAKAVDQLGPDVVLGDGAVDAAEPGPWAKWCQEQVDRVAAWVSSLDPVSDRERAIIRVERNLSIEAERESNVVSISYKAKTPQLAQAVCDAVVDAYQQEHLRIYRSAQSRPFFAEQRDRLRDELDASLEAVRRAKDELGMSSVEERRATLETQFGAVELEKFTTEQELATTKARVAALEKQLAQVSERLVSSHKSIPNEGADLLRDQFYALQMKAMDLEARYSESHPLVQAINEQLAEAQRVVAEQAAERQETTDAINPIHRTLSLDLKQQQCLRAGLTARLAELERQKAAVLADLRTVNEYELTIDRLQRQADLARAKYVQYAQNFEEARMDQELEDEQISNVSVVQAATLAEKPVRPSKLLVALATLVLATAGTVALVLASEQFNDQLRDKAVVADSRGVSVGGTIPDGHEFRRVRRRNGSTPAPARTVRTDAATPPQTSDTVEAFDK